MIRLATPAGGRDRWVTPSHTTVGVLPATIDGPILLIAMPDIFRGFGLNPLVPADSFYVLWLILGHLVVSSVMVVSLGRLGDVFGRVRMDNLGLSYTPPCALAFAIVACAVAAVADGRATDNG